MSDAVLHSICRMKLARNRPENNPLWAVRPGIKKTDKIIAFLLPLEENLSLHVRFFLAGELADPPGLDG